MFDSTISYRQVEDDDFITIETPDFVMAYARERHETTTLYNSHTDNTRRIPSFAAEGLVGAALNVEVAGEYSTHYDIVWNDATWDIKTTFRNVDSPLRLHYECNIPARSVEYQTNDNYLFIDTSWDGDKLRFIGWCSKEEFKENAVLHKKGTVKNERTGAVWPDDYMSIAIEHLHPIPDELKVALTSIGDG